MADSYKPNMGLRRIKEIMFILWLGVVLIIAISLVTYNPADSQLVNDPLGSERITNQIGLVGARISEVLFALFGFCAYGILIFLVYIGYAFLWSNVSWLKIRYDIIAVKIIGFTLLLLSLCALVAVVKLPFIEGLETSFNFNKGGHLGYLTFEHTKLFLGYNGTILGMLILFIMGFYLFTDCSIIVICEAVGALVIAVFTPRSTISRFVSWLRGNSDTASESQLENQSASDNSDFGIKVVKSVSEDPVSDSVASPAVKPAEDVTIRIREKTVLADSEGTKSLPEKDSVFNSNTEAEMDEKHPAGSPAVSVKKQDNNAPVAKKTAESVAAVSPVPEYGRPNLGEDSEEDLYIPGLGAADPDKVRDNAPEQDAISEQESDLLENAGPSIDFREMDRTFSETEEDDRVIPAVSGHQHTNVLPPRPRAPEDDRESGHADSTDNSGETEVRTPVSGSATSVSPENSPVAARPAESISAVGISSDDRTSNQEVTTGEPEKSLSRDTYGVSSADVPPPSPAPAPLSSQPFSEAAVQRPVAETAAETRSNGTSVSSEERVYPDMHDRSPLQNPGADRMGREETQQRPDSRVYEPGLRENMSGIRAEANTAIGEESDRGWNSFDLSASDGKKSDSVSVYQDDSGYQKNVSRSSDTDLSAPESDDGYSGSLHDTQTDNYNVINFSDVREQRKAELQEPDFDETFGDLPSGFSRVDDEEATEDAHDDKSFGSGFSNENAATVTSGLPGEAASGDESLPDGRQEDAITRVRDPDIPSSINFHDGYYDVEVHGKFPPTSIFKSSPVISAADSTAMDQTADNLDRVLKDYRFKAHVAFEPRLDAEGNKMYDAEGNELFKPRLDAAGNRMYDAEGNELPQKLYECGPVITRYYLDLEPGQTCSKLLKITSDISRALVSDGEVMIQPQISGSSYVGVDIPNRKRKTISMRELLESPEFVNSKGALTAILGRDVSGKPFVYDIAQAPHLLIAGTTGSGKSVGINVILVSLMMRHTPETLRLILIDPKQVEFSVYKNVPHLLTPVITDMRKAFSALKWACDEMERRYTLLSFFEVRKLEIFNEKVRQWISEGQPRKDPTWNPQDSMEPEAPYLKPLPFIFVVVDEFADIMLSLKKQKNEIESAISRLTAKARAVGIHLLLATQTPRKEFITGQIKANLPSQIAFKVKSNIESQLVLGVKGAEGLLGRGDMLARLNGDTADLRRLHGAFASDDEINMFTEAWRARGKPEYVDKITEMFVDQDADSTEVGSSGGNSLENDPLYSKIVDFCRDLKMRNKGVSISLIQRQFSIGYNRAANFVTALEQNGVVSPATGGNGVRDILID
ncbi:DNA translocase FtsK 4TM domain-containing protein [Succinimonas amylolytica]|uniref:DNA translocase FtsK 4TM domain-containing protein n=1 Tax=Succinimonas amylolytica TaxID=83769 RepID=UPI0003A7D015|nr:DNA translocase FtsK 4TM domain-containing protein [Succinimonas amylolytica]